MSRQSQTGGFITLFLTQESAVFMNVIEKNKIVTDTEGLLMLTNLRCIANR